MNRPLIGALFAALVLGAVAALPEAAWAYGGIAAHSSDAAAARIVLAYVDPGAAGFVIVSVLGFLTAIGYTMRMYLSRMKQLVFRRGQTARAPRRRAQRRARRRGSSL